MSVLSMVETQEPETLLDWAGSLIVSWQGDWEEMEEM